MGLRWCGARPLRSPEDLDAKIYEEKMRYLTEDCRCRGNRRNFI
ncbi:MAG: hypothetical protein OJF62_000969 [Pseudolabrys sp.]|nr:hypothetical protein [Pseudolabrys sp.]